MRIAYDKETGEKVALKKPDLKGDTNGVSFKELVAVWELPEDHIL